MKMMSCLALATESASVQKSCTASSPPRTAQRRRRPVRHAQDALPTMAANTTKLKKGDRDCAIGVSQGPGNAGKPDRKSTRLNSSHGYISYAVFCLKKKKKKIIKDIMRKKEAMNKTLTRYRLH